MPKITGLNTIDYFPREYTYVSVVVLTGFPETQMAVSCMHEGVVKYLAKPVAGA
ncbi:MAG: response regulator [Nitrospira sp.]|nr:response regulator [Nitrospira sp.]